MRSASDGEAGLAAAGVAVERYEWFQQSESGIAEFPDGSRVAFVRGDPGAAADARAVAALLLG